MKYDRALLEKAVKTYKKIKNRNFVLASELSEKQIVNAIKHIDKFIKPEDVVAFLDSTIFASGKGGILLTTEKIAGSDGINSTAYFEKFIKAEQIGAEEIAVWYSENGYRKIKIKTYAEEAVSLLNTIVKLRDEAEKTAPEKEIAPKAEPPKHAPAPESAPKEKAEPAVKIDMDEFLKLLGMEKPEEIKENPVPAKPIAEEAPKRQEPARREAHASEARPKNLHDDEYYFEIAGRYYKDGRYEQALEYYEKLAEKGNIAAQAYCADMYYSGKGAEKNLDAAAFWFKMAADGGNADCAYNLGVMYRKGIHFEKNLKTALKWFRKAAEGGNEKAMFACGEAYFKGEGDFVDFDEALSWYKKAAAKGDENAKEALGNFDKKVAEIMERRNSPPKEGTYPWYFEKAFAGDVRSMIEIANICVKEGTENNSEEKLREAFFWNLRAAESGDAVGAKKAGMFLEDGTGIPANREKALEFYEKSSLAKADYNFLKAAIENGETEAVPDEEEYEDFVEWAGDFGEILYESGLDFDERFRGYMLIFISAMLGYGDAEFTLGKICSKDSEMGKEDFRKGYYWIDRACHHGCDAAETYIWESWKRDP